MNTRCEFEHTRAEANEELIDTLHEQEMNDTTRFHRMKREWDNQHTDLDDVFFHARDRKQEIKENQGAAKGPGSPAHKAQRNCTQETSWMI